MKKRFQVKVPATSANIGSGFDTVGAAFDLYNIFEFEELDEEKLLITGCDEQFCNEDNLIYQAMLKVFEKVNDHPKGIHINEINGIPIGKGLGSSATCIVGGLVGANLLCNEPLSKDELFELAIEMEGHPDNVTPAFFGGLTTALITSGEKTYYNATPISSKFAFYACIPDFKLSTEEARKLLPESYPKADVIYNISHALMSYIALTQGDVDVIPVAIGDKIHEPYRKTLISGVEVIEEGLKDCGGLASYISGAGPTIMCIVDASNELFETQMSAYIYKNLPGWTFKKVNPDNTGTVYSEILV